MRLVTETRILLALLSLGECLLLIIVGVTANLAMYLAQALGVNLLLSMAIGMILAMAAQTTIAFVASPILGPIESMVPSMVLAMISPMVLCGTEPLGHHVALRPTLALGAGFGLLAFFAVKAGGRHYRKALSRGFRES